MPVPFAINGLGRIGRALVRVALERPDLELVAANDAAEPEQIARLLRHDTVHGKLPGGVGYESGALVLDGRRVPLHREAEPGRIPWAASGAKAASAASGSLTWKVAVRFGSGASFSGVRYSVNS